MDDPLASLLAFVVVIALVLFAAYIFFLPTVVAHNRRSASFFLILLLNLLGGVTGFLWFAALLWACIGAKKQLPEQDGPP